MTTAVRPLARSLAALVVASLVTACGVAIRPPGDASPAGDAGAIPTDAPVVPGDVIVIPDSAIPNACIGPDGSPIPIGASWSDGCNTCTCTRAGLQCTLRDCPPPPDGCRLADGRVVPPGATIQVDACTSCTCGFDGSLACSAGSNCVNDGGIVPPPLRMCGRQSDCQSGERCDLPEGCFFDTDRPGTCVSGACYRNSVPYCTCSGQTVYGSSNCPPAPFQSRGTCATPPPVDSGVIRCNTSADCGRSGTCILPQGCGNLLGTCQPVGCTADLAAFCSCRGVTVYGSSSCPPEPYLSRGACVSTDGGIPNTCILPDGSRLPIGSAWSDGCNTCTCYSGIAGPALACTDRACVDAGVPVDAGGPPPGLDCRLTNLRCYSAPPTCPAGSVPAIDNNTGCWGRCLPLASCGPLPCDPMGPIWQCPFNTQCNARTGTCG